MTEQLASIRQAGGHWFEPSTAHLEDPLETAGFLTSQSGRRSDRDRLQASARLSAGTGHRKIRFAALWASSVVGITHIRTAWGFGWRNA